MHCWFNLWKFFFLYSKQKTEERRVCVNTEVKKKLNETLSDLAYNLQESMGSFVFWGEIVVPECLRKELQEREESSN